METANERPDCMRGYKVPESNTLPKQHTPSEPRIENHGSELHGGGVDFSFARVLVVDDMPSIQVVASGLMKKYKIQVDCASGGEEALNRVKSGGQVYNLILMDHIMPGMDGTETLRLIRSIDTEYTKSIPVIAMSGDESAGIEEAFLKSGFQAFITKPLSAAKLDSVLTKWIKR